MDAAAPTHEAPAGQAPAPRAPARPRRWLRLLGLALFALLTGLGLATLFLGAMIERTPADPAFTPRPLPREVAERFDYLERGTPAEVVEEFQHERGWGYRSRWIKLSVTSPDEDEPHSVQVIHYRSAAPGRRPAVLIAPISGGRQPVARALGPLLARRGFHVAVVLRAERYLDGRYPEGWLEHVLRVAVIDRRRTIDWLVAQPDVDPARIGALGVSMGGLVTSILVGVEPRLRCAVIALAGAPLSELVTQSDEARVLRYVSERAERGVYGEELAERVQAAVPSDPLALAPSRRMPVLQVLAARDTSVPTAAQEQLWQALGRPERIVLPTGHVSTLVYAPWLAEACADWLEAKLGG
ncbi:MAG: alpha/beta hydrolase family protein [Planctomycetota bacterium]